MPQETRKIWARSETSKALIRVIEAMEYAAGSSAALPVGFRRRLKRLSDQLTQLREDIHDWPVTQDERLLKERTGTFYADQDHGSDVEDA